MKIVRDARAFDHPDLLTGDLNTSFAKAPGLFIIARNSAANYKNRQVGVKQIAEEGSLTAAAGGVN